MPLRSKVEVSSKMQVSFDFGWSGQSMGHSSHMKAFMLLKVRHAQFSFCQLLTLSIPIWSISIWSMLTKWELTKWEVDKVKLTKWELMMWELTKWEEGSYWQCRSIGIMSMVTLEYMPWLWMAGCCVCSMTVALALDDSGQYLVALCIIVKVILYYVPSFKEM